MRKILLLSGLILLIFGVVIGWRAAHPSLSDEQQIAATLDGITAAASARQPRGVVAFLSPKFKFAGGTRKDLQTSLAGNMMQFRVVKLSISGVEVVVNAQTKVADGATTTATATSEGRFQLNRQFEVDSAPEVTTGQFKLKWRRENGEWRVSEAELLEAEL